MPQQNNIDYEYTLKGLEMELEHLLSLLVRRKESQESAIVKKIVVGIRNSRNKGKEIKP